MCDSAGRACRLHLRARVAIDGGSVEILFDARYAERDTAIANVEFSTYYTREREEIDTQ